MIDVARNLSNTFAGIAPSSVPMFVLMQLLGAASAVAVVRALYPDVAEATDHVLVPHHATARPSPVDTPHPDLEEAR
jgi:glycerol uptake facilitator-like aquaporin